MKIRWGYLIGYRCLPTLIKNIYRVHASISEVRGPKLCKGLGTNLQKARKSRKFRPIADMAQRELEADSLCFANILEELTTLKANANEKDIKAKVILFKEKFCLNYVNLNAGSRAFVQGLEDVLGDVIFDNRNYLLIASNEVSDASNGFDDSSTDHSDESEQFSEKILNGSRENKPRHTNKVDISSELIVKTGPTGGSPVQFISGKAQLQSVSSMMSVQTVKTELLSALTLKDARYMTSIFVQGILKLKDRLENDSDFWNLVFPWLLIKCNREKPQNIIWLCCKMEHIAKDGTKRGLLKSFVVRDESSVLDLEGNLKKTLDCKTEKCLYFARYDLLNSIYKERDDDAVANSKLALELSWQDHTAPHQPPPSAADSLAKFRIVPSDPSSPLSAIYMELIQLENIVHGVADTSGEVWLDIVPQKGIKKNILEKLPDFIDRLMTVKYADLDANDKTEGPDNDKSPISSYVLDNLHRKDHDFTDELWEFLKEANSFDDVIQSLDFIFAAICTREIQPVFNSENKTDLAQWVREFYRATNQNEGKEVLKDKFDNLLENNAKVLELVANLGLEKFKCDYISFFVNKELATFGQLESVTKTGQCLKDRMLTIWKLHHSLELVAVSIAYLHLPTDYVRMILKASLDYFKDTENLSTAPVFSVSIPSVSPASSSIIDRCSTMKPVLWKCSANVTSEVDRNGLLRMFISTEDRDATSDAVREDDIDILTSYKAMVVTESSVRVY